MSPSASLDFRSALQVEPKRIARLEDAELGDLMGQLLRAQSHRCGAPVSEVRINTEEKAPDGGADGSSGKPAVTDPWLGNAITWWQLKAGKAGTPAALKGEVLKDMPRKILADGGRFALVASGSSNGVQGEMKRLETLTTEAKAAGLPTDRIVVIGSERLAEWVNQHPAIAARWANRPEGLWSLQDWPVQEHQALWQASDSLASELAEYRQALDPTTVRPDGPCLHLHLHGPPGAGKTRLALELCNQAPWADFVVYVQQARESNVLSLLTQAASEEGVRFVVVADDTPAELLKPLRDALERSEGRIRLITLGTSHSPDPRRIKEEQLPPLSADSLRELLGCWYPAMTAVLVSNVVNLAAGNPRLARLAADALHQNPALTTATLHEQPAIRDLRAAIASHQKPKGRSDWSWLQHWDFTIYRSEKRQGFVGRQWMFEEVRGWATSQNSEQALLIGADYGVGKSAFLAELVDTDAAGIPLAAHYFCTSEQATTLTPGLFVRSLATQLAEALPAYREHLEADDAKTLHDWLDAADEDPARALEQAVLAPLASLHPAPQPHLLVVDALDEAQEPVLEDKKTGPLTIVALLSLYAKRLPPWLKLLASSRRRPDLLNNLRKAFSLREIDAEETRNLDDLRSYAVIRCECSPLLEQLASADLNPVEVADFLSSKHQSSGKFLYVALVLNELASGLLPITERADLEALPSDLGEFYRDAFQRRFPTDNAYQTVAPILAVLAEAQEPLSKRALAGILQCSEPAISKALRPLHDLLRLRQVTIELDGVTQKEVHHSFDHLSLKQWLSESDDWGYNRAGRFSINCQEGSEKIHTWALAEVEANRAHTSPYLVRHLASHLRDNERAEVIGMQLLQFPWLQARLRLAGLNTLLEDFNFCTHQPHNLHSDLAILERALRQATQVFNYCNGWTGGWRSASQWVARHLEGWNQEEQMASQLLARLTEVEGLKSLRLHIAEWLVHNGGAAPRKASLARDDPLRILAIGSCVQAVVVLPDNRLAIGCSDDINIRIWNPDSGECVSVLKGHEQGVFCLVSLGERQLASGSLDHSIRIWDLVSGTCSAILQGHGDGVCSLASLGDGRLASGSIDHTIRIWDLARGECNAIVEGHGGDGVFALAFLGDGALASTSDIGPICLWDPDNGISSAIFEDDGCGKYCLVELSDGRIASGAQDGNIRLWDPAKLVCSGILEGHRSWVWALAMLGDGRIASGSFDNTIRIWDPASGTCSAVFQGHQDDVNALAVLGDGRLASGSADQTIRIWNLNSTTCSAVIDGHHLQVMAMAVLADGSLASGSPDKTIRIWDPMSGTCSAVFRGRQGEVMALAVLGDGRLASGGAEDGNIRLWDPAKLVCSGILEGHRSWVWALAMLGDGRIASGSFDNTIRIWDPASGTCSAVFQGHQDWVMALAVLGDGRIASGSKDGTIRLWDPASFSCSAVYRVFRGSRVTALAVLADGRFASGAMDGSICIWDPVSGSCRPIFRGHQGGVRALKLLSDGRIVSGSDDKTIRMWDPRHPDGAPRVLFVADAAITALAWVPTHQLLVAGDASGRLHWLEMGPLKR